ncbi:MAG: hypothetical protein ACKVU4_03900 [Phycisphaerales bacterium]
MIVRGLARCLVIALPLWAAACASRPDLSQLRERPEDFTIAVAVHGVRGVRGAPRAVRPARYVFEADGTLRYVGSSADRGWPPPIRTLPPSVQDEFWRLVRDSGLLERDHPARVYGPVSTDPMTVEGPVAVFDIAYAGAQARARVPLNGGSDESVLAERILDRLADLAWVRE